MRDIGKNIRSARVRKKMTQDALAEKLYVARQTVSNYETGHSRPDVEVLMKIAEILAVDIQELLYGPAEKPEKKHAMKRLMLACVILAALGILYLCTHRQIEILASTYYDADADTGIFCSYVVRVAWLGIFAGVRCIPWRKSAAV